MVKRYRDVSKLGLDAKLPVLECFASQFQQYTITVVIPEFTSVCPKTGLPDFGTITITYEPGKNVIELKSLKMYLLAYRNLGIFYENAVNRILEDIVKAARPVRASVKGEFTPRGGIRSVIEAEYPRSEFRLARRPSEGASRAMAKGVPSPEFRVGKKQQKKFRLNKENG